jgi:hypothetical protein
MQPPLQLQPNMLQLPAPQKLPTRFLEVWSRLQKAGLQPFEKNENDNRRSEA